MNATHVLFREKEDPADPEVTDPEDFERREIEVCRWSDNAPWAVPRGKAAVILRVSFPYGHFARFRSGEKTRVEGYKSYKLRLARNLVATASRLLPGLGSAVEVFETATPLTYRDWGHRFQGSIAGWTWSSEYEKAFGKRILVETPVSNLLVAGIYAAAELFLGGIPTSIHTASLAADRILEEDESAGPLRQ
jgi:phytoene dehydrogenase-like protein